MRNLKSFSEKEIRNTQFIKGGSGDGGEQDEDKKEVEENHLHLHKRLK